MRWPGIVPPYRDTPIADKAKDSSACQRSLSQQGDGRALEGLRRPGLACPAPLGLESSQASYLQIQC